MPAAQMRGKVFAIITQATQINDVLYPGGTGVKYPKSSLDDNPSEVYDELQRLIRTAPMIEVALG